MKKYLCLLFVCTLIVCTAACSGSNGNKASENDQLTNEEIEKSYEEIANDYKSDKPLGSDASVLGEDFSLVDFTFTSADKTEAFNLSNNSYSIINRDGTVFGSLVPGGEEMTFGAGYKTARGMGVENTAKEILEKYKIGDSNAVFVPQGDTVYYTPTNGVFDGKLTAVYASADSISYGILSSGDAQNFVYVRNSNSNGNIVDSAAIMNAFSGYKSVVSIDITADESGNVSQIAFYKFDK